MMHGNSNIKKIYFVGLRNDVGEDCAQGQCVVLSDCITVFF